MLQKCTISNKCCSIHGCIMVFTKILSSTTAFKINNNNNNNKHFTVNQHIRIISEGSYDTEDYSNDVENSALPTQE